MGSVAPGYAMVGGFVVVGNGVVVVVAVVGGTGAVVVVVAVVGGTGAVVVVVAVVVGIGDVVVVVEDVVAGLDVLGPMIVPERKRRDHVPFTVFLPRFLVLVGVGVLLVFVVVVSRLPLFPESGPGTSSASRSVHSTSAYTLVDFLVLPSSSWVLLGHFPVEILT